MQAITKPVVLVSASCVLMGLALWKAPEVQAGLHGGRDDRASKGSHDVFSAATAPTGNPTRVRERPTGPVVELRNLLSHHSSLITAEGINFDVLERFRAKLDALGTDDLLEVLHELDASAASDRVKRQLASLIAGSLARRDPEIALDHFVSRDFADSPGMARQLDLIFGMWVGRDVAAAAEWLDRRVRDEPLASSGDFRIRFEASLVRVLAAEDPPAAAARFAAMSDSAKREALREDWFRGKAAERLKAVATFLREQSDDPAAVIAGAAAARLRIGSLADAEDFLNAIEPTPEEQSAAVAEALRSRIVGGDELRTSPQEARDWILEQAPHDAEWLTGTALGQFLEWYEFSEMSRLATGYRDESGSDEVLAAFVMSAPDRFESEIVKMAGELSDPATRDEVMRRFMESPDVEER